MRNYGIYSNETHIIEVFEQFEESLGYSFGDEPEDFMPNYMCFRAGFYAGGCS